MIQGSKIVANGSNLHEINIVNSKSIGILNIHVIQGSLQYIGPSGADPEIYVRRGALYWRRFEDRAGPQLVQGSDPGGGVLRKLLGMRNLRSLC